MACAPLPVEDDDEPSSLPRLVGRAMTRCECTGVSFEDAARLAHAEGCTVEELTRRTGCGGNCTACIPDLRRFLAARAR